MRNLRKTGAQTAGEDGAEKGEGTGMPFEIVRDDITRMKVDAIVNAANRSLLGGGGVDGAIHRAAGPELRAECEKLGGCETGQAKLTKGYRLPARYVIHTVGPIWRGGNAGERELLSSCYRSSLELARKQHLESVAFPLISAGAYGYPKEEAMEVAVDAICQFLLRHEMTVYLVVFGRQEFFTGRKLFQDVREYISDNYVDSHVNRPSENARQLAWLEDEKQALALEKRIFAESAPRPEPEMGAAPAAKPASSGKSIPGGLMARLKWKELIRRTDEGFSRALLRLIDEKGMKDAECYRKANVDRRLFAKIRSDPEYRPSKPTVFAFIMALELSLPEAEELLEKAGFAISHSSKMDLVIEYCIRERFYDVMQINEVLYELDLPLLGNCGQAA